MNELFNSDEIPFNLAGEPLDESLTPEGEARARAVAESEARKAQGSFETMFASLNKAARAFPDHDDTNENAL